MYLRLGMLVIVLSACAGPRPIHPYRLEGFPGAAIEPGLFPLRDGMRWVFVDRQQTESGPLEIRLRKVAGGYRMTGSQREGASLRIADGFLEVVAAGKVLDRPLKLEGEVGDTWEHGQARYTVFGYDKVLVLGQRRRALVVAADRWPLRDLYWFCRDIGWVRIRTEHEGSVRRDAFLEEFDPGEPVDPEPAAATAAGGAN